MSFTEVVLDISAYTVSPGFILAIVVSVPDTTTVADAFPLCDISTSTPVTDNPFISSLASTISPTTGKAAS